VEQHAKVISDSSVFIFTTNSRRSSGDKSHASTTSSGDRSDDQQRHVSSRGAKDLKPKPRDRDRERAKLTRVFKSHLRNERTMELFFDSF
jgi:hypothetical protein